MKKQSNFKCYSLFVLFFLFNHYVEAQECVLYNHSYDVVNDLGHSVGEPWALNADVGGWAGFTNSSGSGFLSYGPYDSSGPEGLTQVTYELLVADNSSNNLVFTIDVWDATTGEQLAVSDIYQDWFSAGITPQSFTLSYY